MKGQKRNLHTQGTGSNFVITNVICLGILPFCTMTNGETHSKWGFIQDFSFLFMSGNKSASCTITTPEDVFEMLSVQTNGIVAFSTNCTLDCWIWQRKGCLNADCVSSLSSNGFSHLVHYHLAYQGLSEPRSPFPYAL